MALERGNRIRKHDGVYSKLKILQSAAGYYIGRTFRGDGEDFDQPGSRESSYFASREEAEEALSTGHYPSRHSDDTLALYADEEEETDELHSPGDSEDLE